MLCEVCKKKPAAVHMVCMMGDKQVDKWLCRDCAQEYIPAGLGGLPEDIDGMGMSMGMPQKLPDGVKKLINEFMRMAKGEAAEKKPKVTKDGFSEAAAQVLEQAAAKALDCGSEHIGTEHILWGLLQLEDCAGKRILRRMHENLEEIAKKLEGWLDKGAKKSSLPQYSQRIWITRSTSCSRPITGSIWPRLASRFRLRPNSSSTSKTLRCCSFCCTRSSLRPGTALRLSSKA